MLLTLLTAFASGLPKPGEFRLAIQTLPSSLAGGAAVLLTNVALTQAPGAGCWFPISVSPGRTRSRCSFPRLPPGRDQRKTTGTTTTPGPNVPGETRGRLREKLRGKLGRSGKTKHLEETRGRYGKTMGRQWED